MKNQAFYARLRNARSFLRFCQDTHSELSVLKKDGTTARFNAGAVASWNKWAQTGTFKTTGKALTRRERKRLARRLYRTNSYRYHSGTRSHALALAKSAYPRKAVTIHHSALCKSLRNHTPYWLRIGVTVCNLAMNNDRIMRKTMPNKGWAPFPGWSCSDRTLMPEFRASEHVQDNGSKFYLSGVTAHQTAEPPHHYLLDEAFSDGAKYSEPGAVEQELREEVGQEATDAFEKSFTVNLEDPDSVAKGVRIAKRSLRRL